MTAGTVLLWRHGQTSFNLEGRVQGGSDIALNEVGLRQAERGSQAILAYLEPVLPAVIVTSHLIRAHATAQALGRLTGQEVLVDGRLRERSFGVFEGRTREEMVAQWPDEYAQWATGLTPPGIGMESRGEVAARVVEAVSEHAAALEEDAVLVVVSHGSATTQALMRLLGMDPRHGAPFRGLDNCHWSTVDHMERGPLEWRLRAHNLGSNP